MMYAGACIEPAGQSARTFGRAHCVEWAFLKTDQGLTSNRAIQFLEILESVVGDWRQKYFRAPMECAERWSEDSMRLVLVESQI